MDSIVAKMRDNDYSALALVESIVLSVPFQNAGSAPAQPAISSIGPCLKSEGVAEALTIRKTAYREERYSEVLV